MSGWEPAEFHEHVYEGKRLVGVRVTREPEWCEADRVAVIAELERRRLIGSHGQPMDEATDPRGNPSSHDAQWKYVAAPQTDFAKAALDTAVEKYRKQWGDNMPAGITWGVKKVPLT